MKVQALWRYPVKSMLGERCEVLALEARGVAGDRRFAVRDAEGRLGSGKNTRRFRQIDGLFAFSARSADEWPLVSFPDGRQMRGDDPEIHKALSKVLGTQVTLEREGMVSHLDSSPVHLVTTAALAWLRGVLPDAQVDERRFRPNLVIEAPGEGQVEQGWLGKTLRVGTAVLRVSDPTERCRMTTLAQDDLPEDARVLTQIGRAADLCFGVYAEVVRPGRIALGDPVVAG